MNYMGLHVFNNYMYLRASLVAQMAKNPPAVWETLRWQRIRLQCGRPSDGKESTCSVGDPQMAKNPPAVWETWV